MVIRANELPTLKLTNCGKNKDRHGIKKQMPCLVSFLVTYCWNLLGFS